jgi:membrane protein YdbS with pleckstrin-like domain
MSELEKHLGVEERVLWSGKPVKAPFVLPALGFIFFGLFFLGFFLLMFWFSGESLTVYPFPFIVALALGLPFVPVGWQLLRCRNTEYGITNRRVIIQSGAIGKDIRFVDLDKIQEAYVKVGFVDRLFRTGSILILTAGQAAMGNIGGDIVSWGFGPLPKITPGISVIREPNAVNSVLQEAIRKVQTPEI